MGSTALNYALAPISAVAAGLVHELGHMAPWLIPLDGTTTSVTVMMAFVAGVGVWLNHLAHENEGY